MPAENPSSELASRDFAVPVRGRGGESRGELSVSTLQIDDRARYRLMKLAVVNYAANQRVGTHETKTRGDVAGSTKKLYRPKGTGNARAGSRKSPIRRGGGTVFGPHARDYSYGINRKQRRLALRSAIYVKLDAGDVLVVEDLMFSAPRTGDLVKALRALGVEGRRVLIGTEGVERNLYLSARNIQRVEVLPVADFNTYSVLNADVLVLTRGAFDWLAAGGLAANGPGAQDEANGEKGGA